jgi:hypothetical protein
MTTAIDDALDQLRRHQGILRVGDAVSIDGKTHVEIDVSVELPSRVQTKGESNTGVRSTETCVLVFPSDWPLSAPVPYLRHDFPLNLPHINPYRAGSLVSPCIFEGSLDELLHRFGLDAIVDQLIDWLRDAAAGTLLDLAHGWEPTRRDTCPSTLIFNADGVAALAPPSGTITTVAALYISFDGGIHAIFDPQLAPTTDSSFTQFNHDGDIGKWANGNTAAFIARAPYVDGTPPVFDQYTPETVVDFPTLLERATALGIDADALADALSQYYRVSVLASLQQDPISWQQGMYAIIVLVVERPAPLVGSPGRSTELLPYVVHYQINAEAVVEQNATVHAAFHSHALSPELLSRASGISTNTTGSRIVMVGCGSLGSKIALHLGRAGFGNMAFLDNKSLSPHNAARYALSERIDLALPPKKALMMRVAFESLSHSGVRAFDLNATDLFSDPEKFLDVVAAETELIIDTTASLQVLAAEVESSALDSSSARLSRVVMFGQGRCVALVLEAMDRACRMDDLVTMLFEQCRTDAALRSAIAGDTTEPTQVFVGDNCSSLTMPMTDAKVSRSASLAGLQIERWLTEGMPKSGVVCTGIAATNGIGMTWRQLNMDSTTVLEVDDYGGWKLRVLEPVAKEIHDDSIRWGGVETGGALLGRICYDSRTIIIGGLIEAPSDSQRSPTRFILGTDGLIQKLLQANRDSMGYLMFIGTWHSHPQGGPHSGIDRETLNRIAEEAGGLPVVSLVWTPDGFIAVVDRW